MSWGCVNRVKIVPRIYVHTQVFASFISGHFVPLKSDSSVEFGTLAPLTSQAKQADFNIEISEFKFQSHLLLLYTDKGGPFPSEKLVECGNFFSK